MGFKEVKSKLISDLLLGNYSHEARNNADEKNMLLVGKVSAEEIAEVLKKSRMHDHLTSLHHQDGSIVVHVIRCRGWYVKFYFEGDTWFISVHE